jgi:hypothetical protein
VLFRSSRWAGSKPLLSLLSLVPIGLSAAADELIE